jgi:hypothetical protein
MVYNHSRISEDIGVIHFTLGRERFRDELYEFARPLL